MIHRFCLHVRLNKLQDKPGIWLPILYHELNKDDTILVQGWVNDIDTPDFGEAWHLWCETAGGVKIDPHVSLLGLEDIVYNLRYTTDQPIKFVNDEDSCRQWEIYEKNPGEFWKTQPQYIKNFRSKVFSLVKRGKF